MIVDLERNDLGRVCVPGTVRVDGCSTSRRHPTVHHLVSHVVGDHCATTSTSRRCSPRSSPAGRSPGAPKLRAMEIIAELEERPARRLHRRARPHRSPRRLRARPADPHRGGARRAAVRWHAGGGIVADSDPERELAEAWLKTRAIRIALGERPDRGARVLVWLNGRDRLDAREARVSALDRGLLHGDGLYDTWRTYGGEPFAVAAHLRRLAAAAARARPAAARPSRRVGAARAARSCGATASPTPRPADDHARRRRRLPGPGPTRRGRPSSSPCASCRPTSPSSRRPASPPCCCPFRATSRRPGAALKLLGHASAVSGGMLAGRAGAREGLYVTTAGEVTEGTTSNVFLVERGALVTPPVDGRRAGRRDARPRPAASRAAPGSPVREEPVAVARAAARRPRCSSRPRRSRFCRWSRLDGRPHRAADAGPGDARAPGSAIAPRSPPRSGARALQRHGRPDSGPARRGRGGDDDAATEQLFTRKPVHVLLAETEGEHGLKRVLGPVR